MVRAVFPGTFDPIHFGHIDIAQRAARLFDELIVAVYDKPLKSLLFPPEQRIELVRQSFDGEPKIRVMVEAASAEKVDYWSARLARAVEETMVG